jgi:anti-anti-sigma factor
MELITSKHANATVMAVSGRLDANTAPLFDKECARLIQEGVGQLVVDCDKLDYISSAGLRSILAAAKSLGANGGGLAVCNLHGLVQEVFTVSGFASMLPVFGSLSDALAGDAA